MKASLIICPILITLLFGLYEACGPENPIVAEDCVRNSTDTLACCILKLTSPVNSTTCLELPRNGTYLAPLITQVDVLNMNTTVNIDCGNMSASPDQHDCGEPNP